MCRKFGEGEGGEVLKLVGIILIIIASSGMGFQHARRFAARPKQIRHLIQGLQILVSEISYGTTPLKEAMQVIARRISGEIGLLFQKVNDEMKRVPFQSFQSIWNQVLRSHLPVTSLKTTEQE